MTPALRALPAPSRGDKDLAVGAVLFRAHDQARALENRLELEAADPRVAELHRRAKQLRKAIGAALVELAATGAEEVVTRKR